MERHSILTYTICLTIGLFIVGIAEADKWTRKTDMPTPRECLSASVVNGKIYVIGGMQDWKKSLSTVEEYDPIADEWTRKSDMPTPRCSLSTIVVNGKIYAIGGTTLLKTLPTVEEYDPISDRWTKKRDMLTVRAELATSVVNGKIYAFGGATTRGDSGLFDETMEEYDPTMDIWVKKPDMSIERGGLSACAINGKIYVIGGMDNDCTELTLVEEYDPTIDRWTRKADMPTARAVLSSDSVNGKIYAIGGYNGFVNLSTVEEYDPAIDKWSKKSDMLTARNSFTVGVVNKKLYAIGGSTRDDNDVPITLSTIEEYSPDLDNETTNIKSDRKFATLWGEIKK